MPGFAIRALGLEAVGIFSAVPFLETLDPADRNALLAVGTRRAYRHGEVIMRQGNRDAFVVVLLAGWTSVGATAENGRSVIFTLYGPLDLIGEQAALDGGVRSATVAALTDVTAVRIEGPAFRAFLDAHARVGGAIVRMISWRLRSASAQREALATLPVLQRLARLILDLEEAAPSSGPARPALAQHELAAAIGTTRESVAKALADLRSRKVLRTDGRHITVLDRSALSAIAAL